MHSELPAAFAVWFTGLSGAGKSTLAGKLEQRLRAGTTSQVIVLDGDKMRAGLCRDLGFGREDRKENMRRVAEVAKLFVDAGSIAVAALISPLDEERRTVRNIIGSERYIEIYCECSIAACERRDVKGLYRLARTGRLADFTGISSPYEPPSSPDLVLNTEHETIEACTERAFDFITAKYLVGQRGY